MFILIHYCSTIACNIYLQIESEVRTGKYLSEIFVQREMKEGGLDSVWESISLKYSYRQKDEGEGP